MATRSKSFKDQLDNPAMTFISTPAAPVKEEAGETAPDGFKMDRRFVETKSKRLQVLLQPSIYAKLKARAETDGASVNTLINQILISALE